MTPIERQILINQKAIMRALRLLAGERNLTPFTILEIIRAEEEATLKILRGPINATTAGQIEKK